MWRIGTFITQDIIERFSRCHVIHTPSNYVKNIVIKYYKRKNIVVIPPAINIGRIHSKLSQRCHMDIPNDFFLTIGSLEPRKHIDHIIKAMKMVVRSKPDTRLYIVGEGPLRTYLENMIKLLNLEKNVYLTGSLDDTCKFHLLSNSKALIHVGYPGGFGIVILESFALGKPVIAYDVPPLNELVKHGVTGILVRKDYVTQLAKEIARFDKYVFDEKALRTIARNYDINVVADKFAMLYSVLARY